MYTVTYLNINIPKEKINLIELDENIIFDTDLKYKENIIFNKDLPTVYNLYKNNSNIIYEYIKSKLEKITNDDLEGYGKIFNNINNFYKLNVFNLKLNEIDIYEEQNFKTFFLNTCKESDMIIIVGQIRNNLIELGNTITISPLDIGTILKEDSILILGSNSKSFSNEILNYSNTAKIIFSTTTTSWIDFEDIETYLKYLDNYTNIHLENLTNFISIGELRLRIKLLQELGYTQLSEALDEFDPGNRIIKFLESLWNNLTYQDIEDKFNLLKEKDKSLNNDLFDFSIYNEVKSLCYPFSYVVK